jgi:uncharacterized protein (DUF427 family)
VTERGRVRTSPSDKRVRVWFGGMPIVDTTDAVYVWENPYYPQYYVPLADVADGVLVPTSTRQRSPSRGTASHYTVRSGGREAVDAAWSYADSPLAELRQRVRFDFPAMDAWFEENEQIYVHPRDPATRIQILPSSRHAVVSVGGTVVAETDRPTFLFETHLPRRTYFPRFDVRIDLLVPTTTTSGCPYKGTAVYWSLPDEPDIAWSYPTPLPESERIAGLIAFYDDRVDLRVD